MIKPSLLDYAESIIRLEEQAKAQLAQGIKRGVIDAHDSLINLIKDCEQCIKDHPEMGAADRQWLQAKMDKAHAVLA